MVHDQFNTGVHTPDMLRFRIFLVFTKIPHCIFNLLNDIRFACPQIHSPKLFVQSIFLSWNLIKNNAPRHGCWCWYACKAYRLKSLRIPKHACSNRVESNDSNWSCIPTWTPDSSIIAKRIQVTGHGVCRHCRLFPMTGYCPRSLSKTGLRCCTVF